MSRELEYSDNVCPICGEPLKVSKYFEDIWGGQALVETDAKCKCGYHYNYSYGVLEITMPDYVEEDA